MMGKGYKENSATVLKKMAKLLVQTFAFFFALLGWNSIIAVVSLESFTLAGSAGTVLFLILS